MPIERARLLYQMPWPADDVFAILAGWGNLTTVLPAAVRASELDAAGYVRKLTTTNGAVLFERLNAYNARRRFQAYEILDTPDNGVPFKNYHARLRVRTLSKRRCRVDWSSRFRPKPGKSGAECRDFALMIYRGAVESAERLLGQGT